uniref:uncharacterized protein LOC124009479 isoform X2 n=1 Tax=Oncorhynchus gorbuscha TaxID=8017 RepID=UPI001EAF7A7A|nr:uncharacterized protein LOC124009479 isoform X2 [Oncorhynchus gorbuscha]
MASATATYGQKESSDQNFDYMFKILIIGNSSVGKTSFLFRYADDSFTPAFVSTVGIDFKVKTIYRNDKRIKLQIWRPMTAVPGEGRGGEEQYPQYRYTGTRILPDRSATGPSPRPTTEEPWASSSCMTSPTRTHSTPCRTGPPRSRRTPGTTPRSCWWETSVTWKTRGWWQQTGAGSSLTNWALSTLSAVPRTTSTSSRRLSGWWTSSVRRCQRA